MLKNLFGKLLGGDNQSENNSGSTGTARKAITMDMAIQEAQKTLPDYLKFYNSSPKGTKNHRVKVEFKDNNGDEHIWVTDFRLNKDNTITGIVSNHPQIVRCVRSGQEVTVPLSQVSDWGFESNGVQYGNFTVYVMFTQMSPSEVEMYKKSYGFTQNPFDKTSISFSDMIKDLNKSKPVEEDEDEEDTDDEDFDGDDDSDDDDDDDSDDDDSDDDDETYTSSFNVGGARVELDPVTLHGKNYKVEDFDAEVEKRVKEWIKSEEEDGEELSQQDIDNIRFNLRREVYQEWTGANSNEMINWEQANSMAHTGKASYGYAQQDDNNPLLQPIHGVTLQDYAAISYKMATGADFNAILKQLGVETSAWEEANTLWGKRMQEDTSMAVVTLFGQYYNTADQHPKLSGLVVEVSEKGKETLKKMEADEYFYIEVAAAANTAYNFGMDGAKWLMDNHGITNGDLQKIAGKYAEATSKNMNIEKMNKDGKYQEAMIRKYTEIFSKEQGGSVADDVSF